MDGHQGSTAKQLAGLLAGLDRTFRDEFKRSNGIPHHLTLAQFQVISLVAETGQCSQKAIAAYLGVTGPTVVRIIDALERKGLVVRTRDEKDRRIVLVALTDQGTEVQQDCETVHEQRLASVIERLPSEDEVACPRCPECGHALEARGQAEGLLGSLSALLSAAQVSPRVN